MITVYGRVTEMEPTAPPGPPEIPPETPLEASLKASPEEEGSPMTRRREVPQIVQEQVALTRELRTPGYGRPHGAGRRVAVRSGATLQEDIVHPAREVVQRGETVQDGEAVLESRGVTGKEGEPREGEVGPVESWMHIHIALDPPHSGEIEIDAPGFAASAMLNVGARARVMLSAS